MAKCSLQQFVQVPGGLGFRIQGVGLVGFRDHWELAELRYPNGKRQIGKLHSSGIKPEVSPSQGQIFEDPRTRTAVFRVYRV